MARILGPSFVIRLLPHFRALFLLTPCHPVTLSPCHPRYHHQFTISSPKVLPNRLRDVTISITRHCHLGTWRRNRSRIVRFTASVAPGRASGWKTLSHHARSRRAVAEPFPVGWREGSNDHG